MVERTERFIAPLITQSRVFMKIQDGRVLHGMDSFSSRIKNPINITIIPQQDRKIPFSVTKKAKFLLKDKVSCSKWFVFAIKIQIVILYDFREQVNRGNIFLNSNF